MIEDFGPLRQDLHKAINDILREHDVDLRRITGWILIAETSDGKRKNLLGISGDAVGENDLPPWAATGMLGEVIEDAWGYFGPQSEEEDD